MPGSLLLSKKDLERHENARRAIVASRRLLRNWQAMARVMSRNPHLKVELHAGATSCTDGKTVFIKVPMELSEELKHDTSLCQHRDEWSTPLCHACCVLEDVNITVIHEVAHVIYGTFDDVTAHEKLQLLETAIRTEARDRPESRRAAELKRRIESAPPEAKQNYWNMAGLISPYLPFLMNACEDIRVNTLMQRERPGTQKMFQGQLTKVFRDGVLQYDGTRATWKDSPPNAQAAIVVYCKVGGYKFYQYLDPDIVASLEDPELDEVCDRMRDARSVREVYRLSFRLLEVLRRLGYMKAPDEPEDEPEPEQGEDSAPGQEGEDDTSQEEGQEGEPQDGDSESSPGEDQDADDGNVDGDDSPAEGEGEGDDASGDQGEAGEPSADSDSGEPGSGDDEGSDDEGADPSSDDGGEASGDGADSDDTDTSEASGDADGDEASDEADGGSDDSGDAEPQEGDGSGDSSPGDDQADSSQESGSSDQTSGDNAADGGDEEASPSDQEGDDSADGDDVSGDPGAEPSDQGGTPGESSDAGQTPAPVDTEGEPAPPDGSPQDGAGQPEEGSPAPDTGQDPDGPQDADKDTGKDSAEASEPYTAEDQAKDGLPEDIETLFKIFGQHEMESSTPSEAIEEQLNEEAISISLEQIDFFDSPSLKIDGVDEHVYKPDTSILHPAWQGIRTRADIDVQVNEAIISGSLQQLRLVFQDNKRGKHEHNLKHGKVHARVLARRVPIGDDRVFQKKIQPGVKDYFVVIGVDCSGSTAEMITDKVPRLALMKMAVAAKAEMLTRIGIPFAIYAHTGSHSRMDIFVIKDDKEPWGRQQKEALAKLQPYSANLDGHTLEYYRKVAERRTETDKLILYYTDGAMPAANFREELEILQREIKTCENLGIHLVGIGVNSDSPKGHGLDTILLDDLDDVKKVVEGLRERLM